MQFTFVRRLLLSASLLAASGLAHCGEITVSAGSSLSNAFREIAQLYQDRHPGAKVALNFGASGALLQQIAKGAPVDVFASADQETMDLAQQLGLVNPRERHNFARNVLVVVTPPGAATDINRLADLARPGVRRVAIGVPASVPAGRYARRALEAAQLWKPVEPKAINTQNVRQALDYVARGEVDAGFVYASDAALMAGKVRIAFPVRLDVPVTYPIAVLGAGPKADAARRFVGVVLSPAGQAILARYGFHNP